jgi:hypothetical protein
MHKTRELEDTPSVRGMIAKIPHLVEIIEERGPDRLEPFYLHFREYREITKKDFSRNFVSPQRLGC